MKNINRILTATITLCMAFALAACEKDDETANVSKVTTYASFDISGGQFMSVVQGETFTDPGVMATEGETELPVTVAGTVDTSTPGVYEITYSAVNSDNFPGSTTRTVAVLPEPEQEGVDISGDYVRSGVATTVTKLAPGFYRMGNIYGPSVIPAYIITSDGTNLLLPEVELSGFGPSVGTGVLSPSGTMTLTISLLAQSADFQNFQRMWQRQ